LPADGQVTGLSVKVSEERGKDGILLAKRLERAVREDPGDQGAFVTRPEKALYPVHDVAALGRPAMPIQHHQRLGIGHRQRAQQNRLHEAVDRNIGPDAQGKGEDHDGSEARGFSQYSETVAGILNEVLNPIYAALVAALLFGLL